MVLIFMENEDIDFVECVKIVLKRKKMVFAALVLAAAAVLIISLLSFQMSKNNITTNTIIEIGKAGNVLIEDPKQVAEKIKNNLYGEDIKKKFNLEKISKIHAFNIKDTNLVAVEKTSKNSKEDALILKEINSLILKEHQEKFENFKNSQQKLSFSFSAPTEVVKEPSAAIEEKSFPIKKFFVNLIIAGFVGALASVFFCFLLEFWEKNKDEFAKADKRESARG